MFEGFSLSTIAFNRFYRLGRWEYETIECLTFGWQEVSLAYALPTSRLHSVWRILNFRGRA